MAVKINQFIGIILTIFSSFFFSLCLVIAKQLSDISPVELTLYRFFGILLPSISIAIYKEKNIFPEGNRTALFLRCFVGTTGLMLNFFAVQNMNLGDSSVIIYSTPVFVAIFSRIFLGEPCGLFNVFNIILTMLGIIFIVQPSFLFDNNSPSNIWGPVAAVMAAICGANVIVLLRILKDLHSSVVMANCGFFSILYTFVVLLVVNSFCFPCSIKEKLLVIALAVFSYAGQLFLTRSLQVEDPNVIALTRSTTILFSFLWQTWFFDEILTTYSIFGALLIITSVALNALKKYALTKEHINVSRTIIRLLQF